MTAHVLRANARALPLPDDSVDLVVTSPPYLNLRSYQDGGSHYDGQIGSETTPEQYLNSLIDVTAECARVLKPSGSIFINLGDAYSSGRRLDDEFTAQDAAWLAGVIDSDGSISIRVDSGGRSHVAWVRVGQMKHEVVQRIGNVTGTGQVWQDKRGVWNWNAAAQQCRWVLERVWPYLYIKRRQALAAIELMSTKDASGRKGRWNMIPDDELARRERIRQAVLAWNRGDQDNYDPPIVPTVNLPASPRWLPQKSLIGIPWRYALRCIDDLGLILRAEVIWSKPNGLPESVTDRVRRSHEQWFHFTLNPRYYSAVDEIREGAATSDPSNPSYRANGKSNARTKGVAPGQAMQSALDDRDRTNPLGKLPGSVWTIPTEPLRVPDHLGIDHFAAFPTEWPKRIIAGWSPAGVCVECGEGRRPVVLRGDFDAGLLARRMPRVARSDDDVRAVSASSGLRVNVKGGENPPTTITGYACACPEPTADTTPGVVLDPFGGTGTTALVAKALGRTGISVDMSSDYCRLAEWRTNDRDQLAKVLDIAKAEQEPDDTPTLFDLAGGVA